MRQHDFDIRVGVSQGADRIGREFPRGGGQWDQGKNIKQFHLAKVAQNAGWASPFAGRCKGIRDG